VGDRERPARADKAEVDTMPFVARDRILALKHDGRAGVGRSDRAGELDLVGATRPQGGRQLRAFRGVGERHLGGNPDRLASALGGAGDHVELAVHVDRADRDLVEAMCVGCGRARDGEAR
jgi:hypothetical protein